MNEVEKKEFIKTIEEAAAISGTEEVELLEEALMGIFDGNSETFNDLKAAQEQLEENYQDSYSSSKEAWNSNGKRSGYSNGNWWCCQFYFRLCRCWCSNSKIFRF
ncbi:hypothetical protein QUF94_00670 [Peribacillus sp. NJ4]|uniref:hypothetical protein n=1 Tax=Peribacillus TaxID=2675229 RepID=UPI0025A0E2DE|nr:hypothetical protein [Peribacillus sp. NJ4]MDM5209980.1 hypothetical protein [Peribacillus sp. NJ4]